MSETVAHNHTEVQAADSQRELIELAESDSRIEEAGVHSGFVWFTTEQDILLNFYTDTDLMVELENYRYGEMAMGIALPKHSALQ